MSKSQPLPFPSLQVWKKLGYRSTVREMAADNCQQWITMRVLRPLVEEIEQINEHLAT